MSASEADSAENADEPLACPACGAGLDVAPAETAQSIACPACGAEVIVPAIEGAAAPGHFSVVEDHVDADEAARRDLYARTRQEELDGLRVRQMVATKRAAIRSRTYCIVGVVGCAIGAAKLIEMTVKYVKTSGWGPQPVGYVLFVAAFIVAGLWCLRRAAYWGEQSMISPFASKCAGCGADLPTDAQRCPKCGLAVPVNQVAPDFTGLQDGSQFARDLEDVK